ncbi:MAG: hypothetical protein ACKO38_06870, partial [Planctomycetota bacterium]
MKCVPWLAIALTLVVSGYASAQTLGRGRAPANLYGYQPVPNGPPVEVVPPQPMPHVHAPPATRVRRTTPDLPVYAPTPGVEYVEGFPIALAYVAPEHRYPPGWFHDPDAARPRMQPARVPLA